MTRTGTSPAALVIGGSQGIGRSVVLALARAGWRVMAVARGEERLRLLENDGRSEGLDVATHSRNVTDDGAPESIVSACSDRFGRLDAAINVPATTRRRPSADALREDFDLGLSLNLLAPFFVARAAARTMRSQQSGGSVVNIGSLNGMRGIPNTAMYSASKGGLVSLTRALAVEWAQDGIRVNCVIPGFIEGPAPGKAFRDPDLRSEMLNKIPMRRFGTPEEVAEVVLFLVSPSARYVTGQSVIVDGGASIT